MIVKMTFQTFGKTKTKNLSLNTLRYCKELAQGDHLWIKWRACLSKQQQQQQKSGKKLLNKQQEEFATARQLVASDPVLQQWRCQRILIDGKPMWRGPPPSLYELEQEPNRTSFETPLFVTYKSTVLWLLGTRLQSKTKQLKP